jgi:hypothetical protein
VRLRTGLREVIVSRKLSRLMHCSVAPSPSIRALQRLGMERRQYERCAAVHTQCCRVKEDGFLITLECQPRRWRLALWPTRQPSKHPE